MLKDFSVTPADAMSAFSLTVFSNAWDAALAAFLPAWPFGSEFVDQNEPHDQNEHTEPPLVLAEADLAAGERRRQVGADDRTRTECEPQRPGHALGLEVVDDAHDGRKPDQELVGGPDAVRQRLVKARSGVPEGADIVAQAVNRHVPHAGHDAAEGADRRKDPAHPHGPQENQDRAGLRRARNAEDPARRAGVDLALALALGRLGDFNPQLSRQPQIAAHQFGLGFRRFLFGRRRRLRRRGRLGLSPQAVCAGQCKRRNHCQNQTPFSERTDLLHYPSCLLELDHFEPS